MSGEFWDLHPLKLTHTINEPGGKWGGLFRYIFRRTNSISAENWDGGTLAQWNHLVLESYTPGFIQNCVHIS